MDSGGGGGGGEGKVLEGEKEEMVGSEMKPCLSIVDTCCFDFDEFSPPIEEFNMCDWEFEGSRRRRN